MQVTLLYLLAAFIIGSVQAQTWNGTYTADASCNTTACCCLNGKMVLTMSSTNNYTVNSSVSGVCSNLTTFTVTAYTNGFTGWMLVSTMNETLALSSDSNTITVNNSGPPVCSSRGLKNGVIKQQASFIMIFAAFLIGMMINA